jgi:hypothetical protein
MLISSPFFFLLWHNGDMKAIVRTLLVLSLSALLFFAVWYAQPLRGKSTAVPLSNEVTPAQAQAQELALDHPQVQALTSGRRTEVFGVRQVSDCAECYQVEIYNFDEDTAVVTLVDLHSQEVLYVYNQPGVHPGINKRLADLALEIALNAPEVVDAVGHRPVAADMAPVDASLLNTACAEDHLCVSPTFDLGDRNLWAVVDLTTEELAGIAWTLLAPETAGLAPTTPNTGCPQPGSVNRDGWQLNYETTGSDGLRAANVRFNGQLVLTSVKLLEWHVDYGPTGFQDTTGCLGGGGFPIFPYGPTQVLDLLDGMNNVIGFEVVQDFRMPNWGANCNYRYGQHYQFFADGRFRIVSGAYGRGCGTEALYRPIVRIDIAASGTDDNDTFAYWDGVQWVEPISETYRVPYVEAGHGPHELTAENYSWRVTDSVGGGWFIEPGIGQFDDNGRGDDPLVYVTLHKPEEGDGDMGIIGMCCLDNHEHGPEEFIFGTSINPQTPEPITNSNIVLWYVPQMPTDGTPDSYYCWTVTGEPNPETYPCFGGPMFTPMAMAPVAGFTVKQPVIVSQTAVFSNTTVGTSPISYTWDFGDGLTSTITNPTHVYSNVGSVTVGLTAVNFFGSSTITQTIQVLPPPLPVFLPHVQKSDVITEP